ncbi:hypothetical protein A3C96_00680 [Candidatus Uhrbacteria bacterium RIFCSPHIGHO2_02_FULL_60_10]|uniref:Uncharacterized protein n=1 Tax=Candidatus Uhrbacteria bacterium RIFCSPHIGHO2_02_FULL_60_10 TaxID=1802392 RepID=A0A1F7U6Z7_9BACT|nr:MAG: hypothetical protein A3C96_00680 [Candidatus Uhrbacteria bacterium RIFCSPHIGHO2_02_FULL_60_10]
MSSAVSDSRTKRTAGFTLAEAVVAIGLAAILLAVYSAVLNTAFFLRRVQYSFQAMNFIQEELDKLRSLPYAELLNRTDGALLGLPFTRGTWAVKADAAASSAPNMLVLPAAKTALVGETGLVVLPGNYRDNFTANAKIRVGSASPAGWGAGFFFRYRDAENHYRFRIAQGGLALDKVSQGTITTIWSQATGLSTDTWYELEITTSFQSITVKRRIGVTMTTLATVTDFTFTTGDLAIGAVGNALVAADDISVTDASGTSSWTFDTDTVDELPITWQRMSYIDLPSGSASLTIANYLGQTSIKQCTVKVGWTDSGGPHLVSRTILIAN